VTYFPISRDFISTRNARIKQGYRCKFPFLGQIENKILSMFCPFDFSNENEIKILLSYNNLLESNYNLCTGELSY
jgi:hypothetical protein